MRFQQSLILGILAACLLTACGFHLRGSQLLPVGVEYLAIHTSESHSALQRALKKRMKVYAIAEANEQSALDKTIVIQLMPDQLDRRLLSVFSTGQVAEYELIYTVRYSATFPDNHVVNANFEVLRDYQDDPDQVLAKSRELDLVLDEMRLEAADRIIRLLSSQSTQTARP
jgi:LPS-assembly lipoprotein